MLEGQIRNQRQQGMPVQRPPWATLKVIGLEFFLELLMPMLAHPRALMRQDSCFRLAARGKLDMG
jgi:hypothetical protein